MTSPAPRSRESWILKLALVVASSLVGLLFTESAYRFYLYWTEAHHFVGDTNLWYFQASPYRFSADYGFDYVSGSYSGGAVYEGRVIACWDRMEEWEVNEQGTSGRIKGSYNESQFKVLVFGDSYTQRPRLAPDGSYMTWPNYLQDLLEQELSTSAHVINFGRDAYGVLQMFDLAAGKVPELMPDLAVIAFITDDLTRARFWRTTTVLDGRERIMTSIVPDPNPGWDTATDAYLLERRATPSWCYANLESGVVGDPIVRDMENALRHGRRRSTMLANPRSVRQSFVLDRILHGNAFHSTYSAAHPSQLPRHELTDFRQDERLKRAIEIIRESGVPILLVHLATYSEIVKQAEYGTSPGARQLSLVESLPRLIGVPVYGTLDYMKMPVVDLDSIPKSRRDEHPSLIGHRFYAETVFEVLRRHGLLKPATKPNARR